MIIKPEVVKPKIISIIGLTASGKSSLGIKLAQLFDGEIISCDSRQVYKGLDIGSAKVTKAEQAMAVHHLLDVVEPCKNPPYNYFNVCDFQKLAYAAIDDILARGKLPILVGGSGLYSRSIVDGYVFSGYPEDDFEELEKLPLETLQNMAKEKNIILNNSDFNNKRRLVRKITSVKENETSAEEIEQASLTKKTESNPRFEVLQICLMPEREIIEKLVIQRIDSRLQDGMIQETRDLIKNGVSVEFLQSLGMDYFWNVEYVKGKITLEEYKTNLAQKTMNFVKRQRTWFKKERNTIFLTNPSTFYEKSKECIQKFLD